MEAKPSLYDAVAGNSLSSHMSSANLDNYATQNWPSVFSSHFNCMSLFHLTAKSFANYLVVTRSYLCSTLRSGLNVVGTVVREREPILAQLEKLNSGGFLSVRSQPELTTPKLQQGAYVEGRGLKRTLIASWVFGGEPDVLALVTLCCCPSHMTVHWRNKIYHDMT